MIESNVKVFEADVNGINYQQMGIGAIEVIKLYFRRLTFDNLCQQAKNMFSPSKASKPFKKVTIIDVVFTYFLWRLMNHF